ncbi:MAG: DEAD/DEAH box helicase [Chitinispirillaceae bacterium]|jgi:ATP-dependent RNA helicase RhlE|nr:DEAD/DEAH box helicase [Chitinispirillaceae bacterium]
MSFTNLGLSQPVIDAVYGAGHSVPTDIQRQAVPEVLRGRDVMACAPTGTGKTAAFVLPMLDLLTREPAPAGIRRRPRALILTPTRELALQIVESVLCYSAYTDVQPIAIYGGVSMHTQIHGLREGPDVIVATPGRLLDHLQRNTADIAGVKYLVVDEADRMFDMGFIIDVQNIIGRVSRQRQTLLFSATMSEEIRSLVKSIQHDPVRIVVGQTNKPVETVSQKFVSVSQQSKVDLLAHILQKDPADTVLVFSRTKHGADKIARRLDRSGIRCEAIHSNRSQSQRERALQGFKRREFNVLVATDIAARGIDVDGIALVVNFDTPMAPEDYIHRIGRTGRAEMTGAAVTFVSHEEMKYLQRIEQLIGKRCELETYPGFEQHASPAPGYDAHRGGGAGHRQRHSSEHHSSEGRRNQRSWRPSHAR